MPTSTEVRRRVLTAVERGELPAGGPSELAARDLADGAPTAYWARWSEVAAARIRSDERTLLANRPAGRLLDPMPGSNR